MELHSLISDTVKGTMEDFIEDILALSSDDYLHSINEARSDYEAVEIVSGKNIRYVSLCKWLLD